ncbi:MAG: Crp/Fnr family transcriptional regulator [Bacteroidota bacterium]
MTFIPFDIQCYDKLFERFQYLFEPELINEICESGQLRNFKADDQLMDIGQGITHMPLVISGSLKIMTEDQEGNELLLYFLELGDTCAVTLNCCTRSTKSTVRAIAETAAEVLFVPVEKMEEWMIKYQKWRAFVLESYNTRLNEMLGAIDNLAFHNMEERLIRYLKEKAWANKTDTLAITHYQIAGDLNSSRVVISRLMKKLEKDGQLIQHRNKVELLSVR